MSEKFPTMSQDGMSPILNNEEVRDEISGVEVARLDPEVYFTAYKKTLEETNRPILGVLNSVAIEIGVRAHRTSEIAINLASWEVYNGLFEEDPEVYVFAFFRLLRAIGFDQEIVSTWLTSHGIAYLQGGRGRLDDIAAYQYWCAKAFTPQS